MQTKALMNETRIRVYTNGGYAKNMIKSIKAAERREFHLRWAKLHSRALKIKPSAYESEIHPLHKSKIYSTDISRLHRANAYGKITYFLTYPLPERRMDEQWKT